MMPEDMLPPCYLALLLEDTPGESSNRTVDVRSVGGGLAKATQLRLQCTLLAAAAAKEAIGRTQPHYVHVDPATTAPLGGVSVSPREHR